MQERDMPRDRHSDKDRPRQREVQTAYGRYSATEQGDRRRAHEQPAPDAAPDPTAPGQEAERGAYDPDHEYRRYEQPDRKEAEPKPQPETQPKAKAKAKAKGARDLGKRLSELS